MSDTKDLSTVYILSCADETQEITGRAEAVVAAKAQSLEKRASLERADGMESMQFHNGALETFVFETRKPKR